MHLPELTAAAAAAAAVAAAAPGLALTPADPALLGAFAFFPLRKFGFCSGWVEGWDWIAEGSVSQSVGLGRVLRLGPPSSPRPNQTNDSGSLTHARAAWAKAVCAPPDPGRDGAHASEMGQEAWATRRTLNDSFILCSRCCFVFAV